MEFSWLWRDILRQYSDVFGNDRKRIKLLTLTGLNSMYSVSLLAKNSAILCKVLVSLDLSNMYVSLTTLRTFSETQKKGSK